jgi:hypothetical protein
MTRAGLVSASAAALIIQICAGRGPYREAQVRLQVRRLRKLTARHFRAARVALPARFDAMGGRSACINMHRRCTREHAHLPLTGREQAVSAWAVLWTAAGGQAGSTS